MHFPEGDHLWKSPKQRIQDSTSAEGQPSDIHKLAVPFKIILAHEQPPPPAETNTGFNGQGTREVTETLGMQELSEFSAASNAEYGYQQAVPSGLLDT
jgi:hypothetical protein